jgi:putative salt-induced outer membrane protein
MKALKTLVVFLFLISAVTAVHGEEKKENKRVSDQAELSFIDTSGNTEVSTFSLKNTLKYSFSNRTIGTWELGALYGKSDGVKSAERYLTEFRLDHLYSERLYSYGNAGWLKDKFAGIDPRYYLGAGGGYKFLLGPTHFLLGEAGLTYTREDYIDGTDRDYLGGRVFGLYEYVFNDKNKFFQSLEWLPDFDETDNWLLNSETGVVSALNGFLSLKASYVVQYDNEPVVGLKHTDRTFGLTLVANY